MNLNYDAIVVGMGPGAIFFAYEMIKLDKNKKILMIEQGKRVEDRKCPIENIGKCVKCKPFCSELSIHLYIIHFAPPLLSPFHTSDRTDCYQGVFLHTCGKTELG